MLPFSLKRSSTVACPQETTPPMNSKLCGLKPVISNNLTNRRGPAALLSCSLGSKTCQFLGRAEQEGGLCRKPHPTEHLSSSAWRHQQHEAGKLSSTLVGYDLGAFLRLQGRKHTYRDEGTYTARQGLCSENLHEVENILPKVNTPRPQLPFSSVLTLLLCSSLFQTPPSNAVRIINTLRTHKTILLPGRGGACL